MKLFIHSFLYLYIFNLNFFLVIVKCFISAIFHPTQHVLLTSNNRGSVALLKYHAMLFSTILMMCSSTVHMIISAPYLSSETTQVLITSIIFCPFKFDLRINHNLRHFSTLNFPLIPININSYISKIPK